MSKITSRKHQLTLVGAALGLGLVMRVYQLVLGVPLENQIWSDMKMYAGIADLISADIWQANHFFQPIGLPLVILFLKQYTPDWTMSLAVAHCGLSFLTLVFMWKAAEESFGFTTGLITLLVASVHLPWIYMNTLALPETIFTFLLSVCAWLTGRIVRRRAGPPPVLLPALWGLCFSLAFWLKGTHALWGPLLMIGLLLHQKKQALIPVLALGVPVAGGLALHGAFTYAKIGKVQFSASNSGLNFVEGKCFYKKNTDTSGFTWFSPLYHQLDLREPKQWDRPFTDTSYYWGQGFACIQRSPFVLVQSVENIAYLFFGNTTWPLNNLPRASKIRLYELFFSVFLICGMVVSARDSLRRFDPENFLIWGLPVLALFLCVYVFKSEMRYRLPFDVWFIPLSVLGWRSLLRS